MLALALAVAVSTADLRQWIQDQPAVAAYERQRSVERPPGEDAFRSRPTLPRQTACRGSSTARAAAVMLFKAVDSSRLLLTEPALLAKNDGEPVLQLSDQAKQVLEDRGRRYEQDAALYEPACLG